MKKIFKKLRGIVADFWMLPTAIIIMFSHQKLAPILQLFPPMNPEKVGKLIPALVIYLLVMTLVRAYFWAQYPDTYHTSLMSKKNESWEKLEPSQQFLYSRVERWVLLILFGLIITAM